MKVQEIKGLKLKVIYSSRELEVEEKFNEWTKEHPEYIIEDISTASCSMSHTAYLIVNIFYREPDTSNPPYR